MKIRIPAWLLAGAALIPPAVAAQEAQEASAPAQSDAPLSSEADTFHPDRLKAATPRYGGRVIVHMASLPEHMNYVTENSAYTRRMLYEVHESLMLRDWESHKYVPNVVAEMPVVEDTLVLTAEEAAKHPITEVRLKAAGDSQGFVTERVLYGKVEDRGDSYVVTPLSVGNPLKGP
ncbi:MAG: hypothetical protein R3E96_08700 [Planctomycetota bacterium]